MAPDSRLDIRLASRSGKEGLIAYFKNVWMPGTGLAGRQEDRLSPEQIAKRLIASRLDFPATRIKNLAAPQVEGQDR